MAWIFQSFVGFSHVRSGEKSGARNAAEIHETASSRTGATACETILRHCLAEQPAIVVQDDTMPLACFSIPPPSGADARQYPRNHVYRCHRNDGVRGSPLQPGSPNYITA